MTVDEIRAEVARLDALHAQLRIPEPAVSKIGFCRTCNRPLDDPECIAADARVNQFMYMFQPS